MNDPKLNKLRIQSKKSSQVKSSSLPSVVALKMSALSHQNVINESEERSLIINLLSSWTSYLEAKFEKIVSPSTAKKCKVGCHLMDKLM